MVIDTDQVIAQVRNHFHDGVQMFQSLTFLQALAIWAAGSSVLVLYAFYKDWKKKKGYRMAVRERTAKETELLTNILGDGIFEAEFAGKISEQRANALYNELSQKLGLHDLVPKERRLKTVKNQLIAKRVREGKLNVNEWKHTKFSDTIGKFKFWNTSKA